jgi:hypothetical protein
VRACESVSVILAFCQSTERGEGAYGVSDGYWGRGKRRNRPNSAFFIPVSV